jgi:hypothetical protein
MEAVPVAMEFAPEAVASPSAIAPTLLATAELPIATEDVVELDESPKAMAETPAIALLPNASALVVATDP